MLQRPIFILAVVMIIALSCMPNPYKAANRSYRQQAKQFARQLRQQPGSAAGNKSWVGTVNFNLRKPNLVVIHHTAQNSCAQTLETFTKKTTQVSAHYVICRDGTVHHMLSDYLRGWHAGAGSWGSITDVNSSAIGIELDNNGKEPFGKEQITSLLTLLERLRKDYNIPAANFVGHSDVAPSRKTDPSVHFPWRQLAVSGFGLWYTDTTGLNPPPHFEERQALKIIGYGTRNVQAAQKAFALHFLQDTGAVWSQAHRKVLYALMQQY